MKKVIIASTLSLVFMFSFMPTTVFAASDAVNHFSPPTNVFKQDISIQTKHDYDDNDYPIIHLCKHELTLKKGESETLKATLLPGGKSVSVIWGSSNSKIAKVSSSGKITAVAPGVAVIWAESDEVVYNEQAIHSNNCYITVPGGAKDAKPLGTSDQTYSYGKKKFMLPTSKYSEALANVKKSIGGNAYSDIDFSGGFSGLLFGSKDASTAHTNIYIISTGKQYIGYGFEAKGKSPVKTSRGIGIGAKKSTVQQKYGLPSETYQSTWNGKTSEVLSYYAKMAGKDLYTVLIFTFQKSNGTVLEITFQQIAS